MGNREIFSQYSFDSGRQYNNIKNDIFKQRLANGNLCDDGKATYSLIWNIIKTCIAQPLQISVSKEL